MLFIVALGFLSYREEIKVMDFSYLWYASFAVGIAFIFYHIYLGFVFHPFVLVGASFFLLIIIGTCIFSFFKERTFSDFGFNLVGLGFCSLASGLVLAEKFTLKFRKDAVSIYQPNKEMMNRFLIYSIVGLGLVLSLAMFAKFGGLPILKSNANEAKVNFLSGNGLLNLFFKGLPVFSLVILYHQGINEKSLLISHLLFFVVLLITLAAGYRSTTLIGVGEYLFLYLFLKGKKIPLKYMFMAGIFIILFLSIWGAMRRGKLDTEGAINEFVIVVTARPAIMELIIRNFDEKNYFKGSLYYNDFKKLMPGSQVGANVDLKYAIFGNSDSMPELAGVTPSILGEAYMNFGPQGVFWVMLLIGITLGTTYKFFLHHPSFLICSFYLTFVFGIAGSIQSGLGLKSVHLVFIWFWVFVIGILYDHRIVIRGDLSPSHN